MAIGVQTVVSHTDRMDFSGILIIPLAAIVTLVWMIAAAVVSRSSRGFGRPFGLSFMLGTLFMQPWRMIGTISDLPMTALMLGLIALWTAAGCLIGGLPAAIVIGLVSRCRSSE